MGRYLDLIKRKGSIEILDESSRPAGRNHLEPRGETGPVHDWLAEWRELATKTAGLLPDDPRLGPVLEGLAQCDEAFLANDYRRFLKEKAAVLALMNEVPRK